MAEYQAKVWDDQIVKDLEAGRFDALLKEIDEKEIDEEYDAGEAEAL